jgi:phage tail sheath protein FI
MPAGIEATLTSAVGLTVSMSDDQNGRINPKAMNAIRLFPSGITSWGARTLVGADDTGNVDDKYVNVRRMALFIENSLYRGLRFAAFRNNSEPLWAAIRLAAGSFMNGLMIQGAFASSTKTQAYYVVCDATTTTPNDINLGIVNVLVGFAPNKPAEFVHLTVTQIAGQIQA